MRDHRGYDRGKTGQKLRKVLLDHQVHGGTAGGDDNLHFTLCDQRLILPLDKRRTQRGFLRSKEAQLFKRRFHPGNADARKGCGEGGGDACDHGRGRLKQAFCPRGVVAHDLGILGTNEEALSAEDALVRDNLRLVFGKADGLGRAVADAFIAVFAIGLLEADIV